MAGILPLLGFLSGVLRWPRDVFALLIYLQALVYLYVAPSIAAIELPSATQSRYEFFLWWGLVLFCLPFLIGYRWMVGRLLRRSAARPSLVTRQLSSVLFATGCVILAGGYLWVALSNNLLYRRLGHEGIASAQLDLPIVQFALYRTFMELAPFLAVFALAVLRLARPETPLVRLAWRWSLSVTCALYGLHVLVNSRLSGVLFLAVLAGTVVLTAPQFKRVRPERGVLALLLLIGALYAVRVSENVRERIAAGGSALDLSNLDPAGKVGGGEEGYQLRLNGVDLISLIADNVEAQGPAYGTAWAVPLVLSLDPIIRTDLTEQMKRATLTSSKSFLLLQYAGRAESDYYSCMISDAYGNLGLPGFLVVALVLAALCAFATAGLLRGGAVVLVLSCFALARTLAFEQEFATLMFSWFKLSPIILAILLVNPLRRRDPALQTSTLPLARFPIPRPTP